MPCSGYLTYLPQNRRVSEVKSEVRWHVLIRDCLPAYLHVATHLHLCFETLSANENSPPPQICDLADMT
jgi:hypothetical protein